MSKATNTWPSKLYIRLKTYLGIPGILCSAGSIEPGPEAATATVESVVTMLYVSILV